VSVISRFCSEIYDVDSALNGLNRQHSHSLINCYHNVERKAKKTMAANPFAGRAGVEAFF